jgi:hypothetical protein
LYNALVEREREHGSSGGGVAGHAWRGRAVAAALVMGAIGLSPGAARAGDSAAADALFQAAKELAKQGKYAEACPKFEASYKLDRALGSILNLADCHERVDRIASAWAEWGEAADLARKDGDKRAEYADKRRAALTPRLPKLVVRVVNPVGSLDVYRDDVKLDPASFETELPTDAGDRAIVVRRGEQVVRKQTVKLVEGEVSRIELDLAALDKAVPAIPTAKPTVLVVGPQPSTKLRTVGIVVGAVGLGAVVAAAGLEIGALAKKPSSNQCVGKYCTPEGMKQVESAQTLANVGQWVGLGGLVALAVGTTFFLVSPSPSATVRSASAPARSTWVAPWAAPGAGGFAVGGAL